MAAADLRISVVHAEGETVLIVTGELDLGTVNLLSDAVGGELRESPGRIVLDLAGMTFCDSLGLGTLIVLNRTARNQNTFLQLRNPQPFFSRMLEVTGVAQTLNVA